jgi:hypothetical protein
MDDEVTDDIEIVVGLCADCAIHDSLKRLIEEQHELGMCAFCEKPDARIPSTTRVEPMVMLLRALIRFYWDEFLYNHHWGGDTPMALLCEPDNPVVKPPKSDRFHDEFVHLLEDPPYPDLDKGVALYAGHDEYGRGMNCAISRAHAPTVSRLRKKLLVENFTEIEDDLEGLVDPFLGDITTTIQTEELWFRARLGQKNLVHGEAAGWEGEVKREPWSGMEIGSPPPPDAGAGRLNRSGVSMLYLASDPETAIAEIRPHPGHFISVGGFRNLEEICIADFDPDISLFSTSDARLALYEVIYTFDQSMSTPVTPDRQKPYLLTQLLAEVLRRRGFDGVRFRSSVSNGTNLCVFHPRKFEFVEGYSAVHRLKSVEYATVEVPSVLKPSAREIIKV